MSIIIVRAYLCVHITPSERHSQLFRERIEFEHDRVALRRDSVATHAFAKVWCVAKTR
jgi:hypothetical protein